MRDEGAGQREGQQRANSLGKHAVFFFFLNSLLLANVCFLSGLFTQGRHGSNTAPQVGDSGSSPDSIPKLQTWPTPVCTS